MDLLKGVVGTVVIAFLALIPTWIFLGAREIAEPQGFWQELAFGTLGFWVLGSAQFVFGLIGIVVGFVYFNAVHPR